jgi:predicted class III extradiol MEMO1 family dioxygenase
MNNLFEGNANLFDSEDVENSETPQAPSRKLNMGNDRDRAELIRQLKAQAIKDLYKSDPIVRQGINAQIATEAAKALNQTKSSNVKHDEAGNVTGVNHSVVSGIHATVKNQKELAKALRADINKRYGIS